MQEDKKPKQDTIEKLRMILDDPYIQDESIKNKYLIKLQRKLIKPSNVSIIQSKKKIEYTENDDPLKSSVIIHRKEKVPIFQRENAEKIDYKEIEEDLFKDEELYEIEKTEEDIPEFTEIKDENEIIEEISMEEHIDEKQTSESIDNLPEWETVEPESSDVIINKEKEEFLKDIPEWEPITTEQFKDKTSNIKQIKNKKDVNLMESKIELDNIKVFDDIKSIDYEISKILLKNGYNSIDELKELTIKDFTKINGIKRKTAKKIKNDIKRYFENKKNPEFQIIEDEISDNDFEKTKINVKKEESISTKKEKDSIFRYGEYTLYRKEIRLQSDKKRIIHFFCKEEPDEGKEVNLPEEYEVKINKKTGVPYISRIK